MNIPLNSFQIKLYSYLIYIKSLWRLICSSWAQVDSNHRPRAYQARALTSWAMSPHAVLVPLQLALELSHGSIISLNRCLQLRWRWWDSNPWPPACRAGALPTELHPHWFIGSLFSFNELISHWKLNNNLCTLSYCRTSCLSDTVLLRKEVIQPHLPIRLPCYDLTPIIEPTFDCFLLAVRTQASGVPNFHGLTGGVYKARERIHRGMLIRDY